MSTIIKITSIVVYGLVLGALSACVGLGFDPGLAFSEGRLIVHTSAQGVAVDTAELSRVSETFLPKGTDGGLLLDAEVVNQLSDDRFGQHVWILRPLKIYRGAPTTTVGEIEVVSPTIANGGVELAVGTKCRVFSVNMEGRFFIWKGTVLNL